MSWLYHPSVRPVRDSILARLRRKEYKFHRLRPIVFLCGAANSPRRDRLAQYLREKTTSLVFYADHVWSRIATRSDLNALQMEKVLAEISDLVVIIVESPGTFAELGAFSLSDPLRTKLLPIIDATYKDTPSFLTTGPVRWVDLDSAFRPTIYCNLDMILTIAPELEQRLRSLKRARAARPVPDLLASPKHLVFVICDLISIFGPCTLYDVRYLITHLLDGTPSMDLDTLLSLTTGMELVASVTSSNGTDYYLRRLLHDRLDAFQRSKYLDLASEHTRILGAALSTEYSAEILSLLKTAS